MNATNPVSNKDIFPAKNNYEKMIPEKYSVLNVRFVENDFLLKLSSLNTGKKREESITSSLSFYVQETPYVGVLFYSKLIEKP